MEPVNEQDASLYNLGWGHELGMLCKRSFLSQARLPSTSYVKLMQTIVVSVITILLYNKMDGTKQGV
jgi:hypothetical protein